MKFKCAETSPGFPCRLIFSIQFYFLVHCQSPLYQFYQHCIRIYLHHPLELLYYFSFYIPFESLGVFGSFGNAGLSAHFLGFGYCCISGISLVFDNLFIFFGGVITTLFILYYLIVYNDHHKDGH